jgi:hypothetical protein
MMSYILLSIVWSFLGFAIGYLVGKSRQLRRSLVVEPDEENDPDRRDRNWQRMLGIGLIFLAIFTVATAWYQVDKERETLRCQVQFNQSISSALQLRTQYDDQNRVALISFLTTFGQTSGSEDTAEQQKVLNRSFSDLIQSYQQTEKARKDNPIPDVPTGRCE